MKMKEPMKEDTKTHKCRCGNTFKTEDEVLTCNHNIYNPRSDNRIEIFIQMNDGQGCFEVLNTTDTEEAKKWIDRVKKNLLNGYIDTKR